MTIVITGSIGFDYIMTFPGRFKNHILPDQIDKLSLSFLVDSMRLERGGCAPNIAYNLALLGEKPRIMGTVGEDFYEYRAWLEKHGIDTSTIMNIKGECTASFFVSTDLDQNQIASFYTGAMRYAHTLSFKDQNYKDIRLTIISPNDPQAMVKYPRECRELGIPFIYDPSQQIVRLSAEELVDGMRGAKVLVVNEYEFELVKDKTGLSERGILELSETLIVTKGAGGSAIIGPDFELDIPAVPPRRLVDPTGIGDAYRAGIIKGMVRGYSWETTGRIASLAATYALEEFGTQNHRYSREEFIARYKENFGPNEELEDLLAA
ncbi:MAG: carbohydrate kinase family protein [Anaerolineae bacterium]